MELLKSNVVTAFENTATYFYFPESTEGGLDADDSFVVCHIHAVNVYIHEYRYLRNVNKKDLLIERRDLYGADIR